MAKWEDIVKSIAGRTGYDAEAIKEVLYTEERNRYEDDPIDYLDEHLELFADSDAEGLRIMIEELVKEYKTDVEYYDREIKER